MADAGWGRIVSLSSTSALGNRGQANYSTAKAGLQGATKTIAIELAHVLEDEGHLFLHYLLANGTRD